ncbi:SH3 domain-containing protein [Butyrivibrio proteoclasticus]|uniref:SH3 domain-containing protein n=1 Tax=Butyrivibrio proteoclasticus TaxID=43305 RepID=UPI00047A646A|nr:SH3 domain-containing protein [Butyrivibrio proteoclasticus]
MADKITKFEDYRKKEPGDTTDIDIQIEDPYNFFNAEEREEYFRERQKEQQKELRQKEQENRPQPAQPVKPAQKPAQNQVQNNNPNYNQNYAQNYTQNNNQSYGPNYNQGYGQYNGQYMNQNAQYNGQNGYQYNDQYGNQYNGQYDNQYNNQYADQYNNQYNGQYDADYDDDDYGDYQDDYYQDEEPARGGFNPEHLVRIASIITGLIILICIAFIVKVKVVDKVLAPDPDEQETVVTAIPAGFVEKNDTVTVSGASSLNLRSGPGTDSAIMGKVDEGTQLKRIAVAEDGSWALVEYEGQQVYASMKYLKE